MTLPNHLTAHHNTVEHLFKTGCSIETAIHWVVKNYDLTNNDKNILYLKHYRDQLDDISEFVREYESCVGLPLETCEFCENGVNYVRHEAFFNCFEAHFCPICGRKIR